MNFEMALGIYKQTNADPITFTDEVIHTESFEVDFGAYPLSEKEIPYKLLESAKAKAEKIVHSERRWSDCKWYSQFRNLYDGYWWKDPRWETPEITEVYKYHHQGFGMCLYIKLSWDMDTLERTASY